MIRFWWTLLLLIRLKALAELDNELIGTPEIKCNPDTIEMKFTTKRRFTGKIYVQGHYNNPDCRVDYSQTNTDGSPLHGIRLHHGACDMDRQRMIQPEGMKFSSVLMVSFHPLFVTKADRAFHINCLYKEAVNLVSADLEVSDPTTELAEHDTPMPQCKYSLRKDELDGEPIKYSKIGDQVVHRWECDSDMYGMLVHNCYVEDGQGEKRMVIDERGCHVDLVLGDPTYTEALNMAYRESNVFKFADKVGVRFLCEIKLCLKDNGGCDGITPPNCGSEPNHSFQDDRVPEEEWVADDNATDITLLKKHRKRRSAKRPLEPTAPTVSADLISQYVYVLDSNEDSAELARLSQPLVSRASVCVSWTIFGVIMMTLFLIFTVFTAIILNIYMKQYRIKQFPLEPFDKLSYS
ncbi:unnamed protein product [Bursaphelenchus okinawaensis]|uniref:ZP domain-containing protein n=1 Tax=Bursaphelenchus okinawaensis TaxID=465554 RepID=A0A811LQ54_9BILA|nr:unnamed protein product [Bursaphelenchus okinawaensis]CAG9126924.1 unnamed protein product [Bursaphelenchus okinawaensis]